MRFLFYDTETTGLLPDNAEVIEAYFVLTDENLNKLDEYYYKSRVDKFNYDAYEIHGISFSQQLKYPCKELAIEKLCEWIPSYDFLSCYCNTNNMGVYYHFDNAVFKRTFLDIGDYHAYYKYFKEQSMFNVWQYCKDNREIIYGKTKSVSFKQLEVYKALFNSDYPAHNAKSDVYAMIEIVKEIKDRKNANQLIFS